MAPPALPPLALAPEAVQPLLPRPLAVETFEGVAYLGLVAFTIRDVRGAGLPSLPAVLNFHEVNRPSTPSVRR